MAELCLKGVNIIGSDGVDTIRCWGGRWGSRKLRGAILMTALLTATASVGAQVNVTTSRYNNQRTSVNSSETILTPSNVNSTDFGKLFSQAVDGYVFAQRNHQRSGPQRRLRCHRA